MHHIYLHSKFVDMIVAAAAAAGSIDMDGRHAWSVLAAADAGDAAAAVADAGDAAESMQFRNVAAADAGGEVAVDAGEMEEIHRRSWKFATARRGVACGCPSIAPGSFGVVVDIPIDSSTNPLVALCRRCILHIFVAAA